MKKSFPIIVALIAFALFIGWRVQAKMKETGQMRDQQAQRKKSAPNVETAVAGPAVIEQTIDTVGSVETPFAVKIAAKTAGAINFLEVREGDKVVPGQVLVKIDPDDVVAQVLQQQSNVAEARARLAQAALTQDSNATGVNAQIRQQKASLESAKTDFSHAEIDQKAQIAAAEAQVQDSEAKVSSAKATVESATADVESAKANLENAKTRLSRMESLFNQQFIAAQEVDDARTVVKVQQGSLLVAQRKLDAAKSSLRSAQAQLESQTKQAEIAKRKSYSDLASSKAKLTQATANFDVASANRSQTRAYRENLAALKAGVDAAVAQLAQAKAKLADTTLRSTIKGTVTARNFDSGSFVSAGQQILMVQFLDWLYITCYVPIDEGIDIKPGQDVNIAFDAFPKRVFRGKVDRVNPAADPASRQFKVSIKLDNADGAVRPGMYTKVGFVKERTEAKVAVPREAITRSKGKTTIAVIAEDGTATIREVVLGATNNSIYEVKEGLKSGERIVTLSYSPIKDGQKVKLPGDKKNEGDRRGPREAK